MKLSDLEEFYINGIIKTSNKEIIKASISRLLSERVRIFSHLELTKTLFLELTPNLESIFNTNITNDVLYNTTPEQTNRLLIYDFKKLLFRENIKLNDINTLKLSGKKQEKILSITKDNIKDKIENIVISPKEEVKKGQLDQKEQEYKQLEDDF